MPQLDCCEIEDILREEDIEGLMMLGAPRNEYRYEAKLIHQFLEPNLSLDEIYFLIEKIFWERFCSNDYIIWRQYRGVYINSAANKIYEAMRK